MSEKEKTMSEVLVIAKFVTEDPDGVIEDLEEYFPECIIGTFQSPPTSEDMDEARLMGVVAPITEEF